MRIAYFINQYPMVSHSFIRREILALEGMGCNITRIALRSNSQALVDQRDKLELEKTKLVLKQSYLAIIKALLSCLFSNPASFYKGIILAINCGWHSGGGVLKHIICFVEACVVAMWLKQADIQHVHAHFGTNSATIAMLARVVGGVPYSFKVHGSELFDKSAALSLAEKIKHATFVVAISSFGKSQLFRWIDFDLWHKVKTVHCGLEKEFSKGKIPPVPEVQRLVCVARLCEPKGLPLLLEAVQILAKEGRKFELVLAGDGPLRTHLEQLITTYDLHTTVTITGWISSEKVKEELLRSRALVLPSFAEGLPVVIMEAMALERPVVSTYVAGIPELVIPGENGWLVTAGDVEQLVETLREVLDTKIGRLRVMGKKARTRVLERHDVDKEAKKLMSFIKTAQTTREYH